MSSNFDCDGPLPEDKLTFEMMTRGMVLVGLMTHVGRSRSDGLLTKWCPVLKIVSECVLTRRAIGSAGAARRRQLDYMAAQLGAISLP